MLQTIMALMFELSFCKCFMLSEGECSICILPVIHYFILYSFSSVYYIMRVRNNEI